MYKIEDALKDLQKENSNDRKKALVYIQRKPDERAVNPLISILLYDQFRFYREYELRHLAVKILQDIGDQKAIHPLLRMLGDCSFGDNGFRTIDTSLGFIIGETLYAFGISWAGDFASSIYNSEGFRKARLLRDVKDERIKVPLEIALRSSNYHVQEGAILILKEILFSKEEHLIATANRLLGFLYNRNISLSVTKTAIEALGELADPKAIEFLVDVFYDLILSSNHPKGSIFAIESALINKGPSSCEFLIKKMDRLYTSLDTSTLYCDEKYISDFLYNKVAHIIAKIDKKSKDTKALEILKNYFSSLSKTNTNSSKDYNRHCSNVERIIKEIEKGKHKNDCFVASVVFSPDSEEVIILREFRDQCLIKNIFGVLFIRAYYRFGHSLAIIVSKSWLLKMISHKLLTIIIYTWSKKKQRRI